MFVLVGVRFEVKQYFVYTSTVLLFVVFLSRAKRSDLISNTNFFQRDTRSAQTLVNLFLETGGPAGVGVGSKSFVAELLEDGLEFPNAILQDGYI